MPGDAPRWWYATPSGPLPILLSPVAALYGAIAVLRYRRARPYRSPIPVICIGNFTAGGTGKTPLALHIARLLLRQGHRPAFLSRGYGGRLKGPHAVDPELDTAGHVGDEPLLLARQAPAFVARDRVAGARAIERTGATHILMDDGLQNPSLHKDLTLAVIDAARGLGNGCVLPAGPLRAPLAFQLRLADALVVNGGDAGAPSPAFAAPGGYAGPVLSFTRQVPGDLAWLREKPFVAFAGIGRPEGFFATARQAGAGLLSCEAFPDHHRYTATDAQRLLESAQSAGAGLLTTEKDLVRLAGDPALNRLEKETKSLPIQLRLADGDEARLLSLLAAATKR